MKKSQKQRNSVDTYEKYVFANEEEAKKAKRFLTGKFPGLIIKTNPHGSLFVRTKGSLILSMKILADVIALGGANA